jgi:hypothetical protein
MTLTQYGTPGGSLSTDGHAYGSAARVGAFFERRVAAALEHWLDRRPEPTYVFHDLSRLRSQSSTGRKLDLGNTNIDHVLLTGSCWVMFDAKGVAPGRLVVEQGKGYLITASGEKRAQEWLDDQQAHSRAGFLHDMTGLKGVPIWVLPDGVDYSALGESTPRCIVGHGVFSSIGDVMAGDLEGLPELQLPLTAPDPSAIEALKRHVGPIVEG